MPSRLRDEAGIGLIELLIAMLVMSIGIFALVAGLSSGIETTMRASKTSTAGTLADAKMEAYRRGTYAALAAPTDGSTLSTNPPPSTAADGRTYWIGSDITLSCIFGGTPVTDNTLVPPEKRCPAVIGPPARPKTRTVTVVTVTVRDGSSSAPVLIKQSSTFEESSGS